MNLLWIFGLSLATGPLIARAGTVDADCDEAWQKYTHYCMSNSIWGGGVCNPPEGCPEPEWVNA